jgi:hypothetical protein
MKEFGRAVNRTFLKIPQEYRDLLTIALLDAYMYLGSSKRLTSEVGNRWRKRMVDNLLQGRKIELSSFAMGLLDGFILNSEGEEKIPNKAAILVVNEPNTGPLRGNWSRFLVNLAVAKSRGRQANYEARWVQKELTNNPFFQDSPIGIQRKRISKMIEVSAETILVNSDGRGRKNLFAVRQMLRHLDNNGVLVICPEGEQRKVLGRGKKEAGDLISFLINGNEAVIQSVAVWDDGYVLNIRFGEVVTGGNRGEDGQQVADRLMIEIAKLLPEERRGVYSKVA